MAAPKILVIPGSLRSGSHNVRLAALAAKELTLADAEVTRISLGDFPLPLYDADNESRAGPPANAVKLKQLMAQHQGVLITSPEYNASIAPVLKNALDWISRVRDKNEPAPGGLSGTPIRHRGRVAGPLRRRPLAPRLAPGAGDRLPGPGDPRAGLRRAGRPGLRRHGSTERPAARGRAADPGAAARRACAPDRLTRGYAMDDARDRLIVALDVPSVEIAEGLVERLDAGVNFYKVGYQLAFANGGLDFAAALTRAGKRLFLDMKLHDIGNTVAKGVESVARMGATFLTVHAYPQTMHAAVEARAGSDLRILAVTVLTSYDDADIAAAGYDFTVRELVAERAAQARDIGVDGLVCSGEEAGVLRGIVGPRMALVTPGIRPSGADTGDQKRVVTPASAIAAGRGLSGGGPPDRRRRRSACDRRRDRGRDRRRATALKRQAKWNPVRRRKRVN